MGLAFGPSDSTELAEVSGRGLRVDPEERFIPYPKGWELAAE